MRLDSRFVWKVFMSRQRGWWVMDLGLSSEAMALEVVRVREQSMPRLLRRVLLQICSEVSPI